MRVSTILRFWQPVAIYAIKEFSKNPMLCCCVLADVMGRGKTWTLTGYLVDVCPYFFMIPEENFPRSPLSHR